MPLLVFLVVITVLVFFHELGHYLVARWRGVRVETFSVGFGPEALGWTDTAGTRWKMSWIPLGGYVKFFGDVGVASGGVEETPMTPEERAVSFHHKPLGSRAAIAAAGPAANFVLAVVLLAGLYATVGQPFSPAVIDEVQPGTVAAEAGFRAGDRFVEVGVYTIDRFEDLRQIIVTNPGREMEFVVLRDGAEVVIFATPGTRSLEVRPGMFRDVGFLGVRSAGIEQVRHGPAAAVWYASRQTAFISEQTLIAVGRMLTGRAPADDLRGPIGIAELAGEVAQIGITPLIEFMAFLSISLGLINLFPIPILDGGHLLFYAFELVRGKPLSMRAQEFGYRVGLTLVLMLMVFATWNDVTGSAWVERLRGLF